MLADSRIFLYILVTKSNAICWIRGQRWRVNINLQHRNIFLNHVLCLHNYLAAADNSLSGCWPKTCRFILVLKLETFFFLKATHIFIVTALIKFMPFINASQCLILYLHLRVWSLRSTCWSVSVCVFDHAGVCHSPHPVARQYAGMIVQVGLRCSSALLIDLMNVLVHLRSWHTSLQRTILYWLNHFKVWPFILQEERPK